MQTGEGGKATLWLWGHKRVPVELEVERYPFVAWAGRVLGLVVGWIVATVATLVGTFDPFIACFPFVIGLGMIRRGIRGRYRVRSFAGSCPRCDSALHLAPGSRISLPHRFDCFRCHFEPELHLGAAPR